MTSHDQQNLFESYLKINEDLGLGPKQDGTGPMKVPSIGQSSGGSNTIRPNMDPAKSSITPNAEDEEGTTLSVEEIRESVKTIKAALDHVCDKLEGLPTDKFDEIVNILYVVAEKIDSIVDGNDEDSVEESE